jgi:homoserine O-acetyltransferase
LNSDRSNAILICHALTANADAAEWWGGLVGPGKAFDTDRYFVVSPNILGSCYGTTGPTSLDSRTGRPFGPDFPPITVRDIVRVQKALLDTLGVRRLTTISGSSLGGMQVLEWAIMYPDFCASIIPISTSARQSAWCIALNAVARAAIVNSPEWNGGQYTRQPSGMGIARMIGMISYRSPLELEHRFGRDRQSGDTDRFNDTNLFQVESYLRHQGNKLVDRFDANTYITLSRAMDFHDISLGRGSIEETLAAVRAAMLCIGVSTDIRYPTHEQHELVRHVPGARYAEISSVHGHDAFLIEFDQLNAAIKPFLAGL